MQFVLISPETRPLTHETYLEVIFILVSPFGPYFWLFKPTQTTTIFLAILRFKINSKLSKIINRMVLRTFKITFPRKFFEGP